MQATFSQTAIVPYRHAFEDNAVYQSAVKAGCSPGFGYIEAMMLHGMIRWARPRRVLEIGSGVSTVCTLAALDLNQAEGAPPADLICVEPYPSPPLRHLAAIGRVSLRSEIVQQTPLEVFDHLGNRDVLFIDSSHVAKAGSDVVRIVLDILPRLRPGVIVHIHDIYLPYAYQRDVLTTFIHNNETPMILAFLTYNPQYSILAALSHLHYHRRDLLHDVFPAYNPQNEWRGLRLPSPAGSHFPSSLWLRVVL